ncbi:uncharacterized protein METZ01_LOCUS500767, partial [marine metagenome]
MKKNKKKGIIIKNDKVISYGDGYDDEFYFEYKKEYKKHKGNKIIGHQVHPIRPSKLPKDLNIDYLGEESFFDIPVEDEYLKKLFDFDRVAKTDSRKFDLSRECLLPEEMVKTVTQPKYLNRLMKSSIDARGCPTTINFTDFYANIILHTKAIIKLKLFNAPVFPEIEKFYPDGFPPI